ncbi:hypothetical protein [Vampirovibrio sp.]|uniref:hypothetical protein n=1 Tax=Vampirovibrio sp. TaxID=2717857 RepID=UPI003593AE91
MNPIEAAAKSFFLPVANPPVRGTFPLFQGAADKNIKVATADTFNGKPQFSGSPDLYQFNTHTLGRLDIFI